MIYELMIILLVLLVFSYFLNRKDIIAPSFIFCLSFVFCVAWAIGYSKIWELDTLHSNTFFVIVGGVSEFIFVGYIVQIFFEQIKSKKYLNENFKIEEIYVNKEIKTICLLFSILTLYLCLKFVIRAVNGSWKNVAVAVAKFDRINKFSNVNLELPRIVGTLKLIVNAMVYWYVYVLINNYLIQKKVDIVSLLIVIVSSLVTMAVGGRNGVLNIILAFVSIGYLLARKKYNFKSKMNIKAKVAIILLPITFIMAFPKMAGLLGRPVKGSSTYYMAIYCGAEIKNLDIYLQERNNNILNKNELSQTFINITRWIAPKIGYKDVKFKLDLPFRYINGVNLGNVYTTFYPFIYDYGYLGVVYLIGLMSIIVQFVYEKSKRVHLSNKPSIWIIIYGYMFSSIVLSFFSNKFYEQNFNKQLIYAVVFWYFMNCFSIRKTMNKT